MDIKDIIKVINCLKGTSKKNSSQKGGLLNFLRPLMSLGLLIMENLLSSLARSVFYLQDLQWQRPQ